MRVFLAGTGGFQKKYPESLKESKYILESYFSINESQIPFLKGCEMSLIDSGAFTFMNSYKGGDIDWEEYLDGYIRFINKHKFEHYIELDIDNIIGYDKVKKMTARLERETGVKPIPAYHISRGKDEFIRLCEEYDYIALGGFVGKDISPKEYIGYMPWFIKTAHSYGTEVHGLGMTDTSKIGRNGLYFDSVDSTSWLWGRFGYWFTFEKDHMKMHPRPEGTLRKDSELDKYNFEQWCKFQKYADEYL